MSRFGYGFAAQFFSAARTLRVLSFALALAACGKIDLKVTTLALTQTQASIDAGSSGDAGDSATVSTLTVSGNQLYDACGNLIVLRGINEMVTFIPNKSSSAAFSEIVKTGANSVRVYWRTSDSAHDLDNVLGDAEAHGLIPIVYVFNGESDQQQMLATTTVSDAVGYWTRSDVLSIIQAHQRWLIIALREKTTVFTDTADSWASKYDAAVSSMRAAAVQVPLAIDAPNDGTDMDTLLSFGQQRIDADVPLHNLLLNVNSGLSDDPGSALAAQLTTAYQSALPLMVGELSGYSHTLNYSCGDSFMFSTVIAAAQQYQMGWMAWSWGYAKNEYCLQLDMTSDGTYEGLEAWGLAAAVTDPNSIANTSQPLRSPLSNDCSNR